MDKPKEWYTDIFINKDVIEINDDWRAIVNGPVKNLKYHANESRITINYEQDFEGKTKGEAKFVIGTIDINRFTLNYAETMDFHYKDDSSRAMSRHGKCTVQNADLKIK